MTLTGSLPHEKVAPVKQALAQTYAEKIEAKPVAIDRIALFKQGKAAIAASACSIPSCWPDSLMRAQAGQQRDELVSRLRQRCDRSGSRPARRSASPAAPRAPAAPLISASLCAPRAASRLANTAFGAVMFTTTSAPRQPAAHRNLAAARDVDDHHLPARDAAPAHAAGMP